KRAVPVGGTAVFPIHLGVAETGSPTWAPATTEPFPGSSVRTTTEASRLPTQMGLVCQVVRG
ncbi:MAG: hypothetical protein EBT09_07415, partial [Actinobacteria bacterium]|nr:hypothetical protein [Actinomycetota bacterium]